MSLSLRTMYPVSFGNYHVQRQKRYLLKIIGIEFNADVDKQ